MTSTRSLKLAANAGDPDEVLALRIDVVAAAVAWYDVLGSDNSDDKLRERLDDAELKLESAVRRYKLALAKRRGAA